MTRGALQFLPTKPSPIDEIRAAITLEFEREAEEHSHANLVQETRAQRHGAGHYADDEAVERAIELRKQGLSIREIMRETGLAKETVIQYAPRLSRSDGLRRMHARLKAEGRPMLPPWRRRSDRHPFRGTASAEPVVETFGSCTRGLADERCDPMLAVRDLVRELVANNDLDAKNQDAALVVLTALMVTGANEREIVRSTGLSRRVVDKYGKRLRKNRLWRGSKTVGIDEACEGKDADYDAFARLIALLLHIQCAEGTVTVTFDDVEPTS